MTREEQILSCQRLVPYLAAKLCPRRGQDPAVRAAGTWDDLLAEGYVALCQAAQRFDPTRGVKFSTYVGRAIYHALLHHLRVNGNLIRIPKWCYQASTAAPDLPEMFAGSEEALSYAVLPAEDYEDLYEALARLNSQDRELLWRHYWANEKLTTIARQEGLTRATLSWRHRRALEQLRQELEGEAA